MKRNLLILVIILLIGFIVNSCGDDENECSICKSGHHCYTHCVNENCNVHDCENHNKSACDVCNPKCKCPEGTIHFIGDIMQCASENNCNCEHGAFTGARASNGIAITNRNNSMRQVLFNEMVIKVNNALAHNDLSSEARQSFIKNNLKEVRMVEKDSALPPYVLGNILMIECDLGISEGPGMLTIRTALRTWCEENNK